MQRRRLLTLATTLLIATVALPSHARTEGSGRSATETRAVSGFQAIALHGSIDLVVRQSGREAVELRADDNLLPLIETVVEGDTLRIGFRKGESVRTRSPVLVTVDVAQLKALAGAGSGDIRVESLKTPALALSLSGSGDAQLRQLSTDEFSLRIAGSGDVLAEGHAARLKVSIAGSGDVDARQLASEDVTVSIAGSGDARVHADKRLAVSIAGSGDVSYSGNAAVKMSVVGSGSVSKR